VKLWQATNPNARDFRIETLGPKYESTVLSDQGDGVYVARVGKPEKGWTAFFMELTFPSGCQVPFKFTTQVRVIPDTLPYKFIPAGPPR
jgi:PhoPQ-activated pathogenicity-related protein